MVKAKQAFKFILMQLQEAGIQDYNFDAHILFEYAIKRDIRLLSADDNISDEEYAILLSLCEKRKTRYPLQYLIGEWGFMSLTLKIGEGVLIPRADTECVCVAAAEKIENCTSPTVLDLCAGSGALGLGIKSLLPTAQVTAVELYDDALVYLKQNSLANIQVVKYDVFKYQECINNNCFDLIAANPPYIANNEKSCLDKELFYEPPQALFDNGDGLSFYRHIAKHYMPHVKENGYMVFEIGHLQGSPVSNIMIENNWREIEIIKDFSKKDRAVIARK